MVNSVGFSNVYSQYPQYAAQRQAYMPQQQISFAGTPQQSEEAGKKKTSTTTKVLIGTAITALAAVGTLYGLYKTGKLTKVENASKWTEKLQNFAFKGGEKLDKGVTKAIEWGRDILGKTSNSTVKADTTKATETATTAATGAIADKTVASESNTLAEKIAELTKENDKLRENLAAKESLFRDKTKVNPIIFSNKLDKQAGISTPVEALLDQIKLVQAAAELKNGKVYVNDAFGKSLKCMLG